MNTPIYFLVGNKADRLYHREVTKKMAWRLKLKYKLDHFAEVSAKTGKGVE